MYLPILSTDMFLKNIPVRSGKNGAVVGHIDLNITAKVRDGYLPGCCQTLDGEYVYVNDTVIINNQKYKVKSLVFPNRTIHLVHIETGNHISIYLDTIHGKCQKQK